jgi:hypothetical protein
LYQYVTAFLLDIDDPVWYRRCGWSCHDNSATQGRFLFSRFDNRFQNGSSRHRYHSKSHSRVGANLRSACSVRVFSFTRLAVRRGPRFSLSRSCSPQSRMSAHSFRSISCIITSETPLCPCPGQDHHWSGHHPYPIQRIDIFGQRIRSPTYIFCNLARSATDTDGRVFSSERRRWEWSMRGYCVSLLHLSNSHFDR